MTLQQAIYKSIRPLSVSSSFFAIVGLDWCWKEYSIKCGYGEDSFQREFYGFGHASFGEGLLFDSFLLLFLVKDIFNADC